MKLSQGYLLQHLRSGPRRAIRQCEYQISFYQIYIFEFAVKLRVADFIDKKFNVLEKTCNFFLIKKQSREEEMQPIKKIYFSSFVFSTRKVPLAYKLQ